MDVPSYTVRAPVRVVFIIVEYIRLCREKL